MMDGRGKSDSPVVPEKFPNKTGQPVAEGTEGRGLAKGNLKFLRCKVIFCFGWIKPISDQVVRSWHHVHYFERSICLFYLCLPAEIPFLPFCPRNQKNLNTLCWLVRHL